VTPRHGGAEEETLAPGYRVHRVGHTVGSRPAKFLRYQSWQWAKAKRLHRERPFDLAHLTYGVHASLLQPRIQRGWRVPVVIDEHHLGTGAEISDASQNPFGVGPLLRRSYRRADAIIAQSRDTGAFVEATSGRKDWTLVPLGSDAEQLTPDKRDARVRAAHGDPPQLLVTVSRISARKNLGAMLDAMALVRKTHPRAKLVIVGDGPERGALRASADARGLADAVELAGYLPDAEVARLLASSDVFLSTSTYEAFGLSLVDAMASGLPVVAFDARGPADFLRDGEAGFVTPHDPAALAQAVTRLLDDPDLARRMGQRGREIVEKRYNWDANADARLALFRRLVQGAAR